MARVSYRAIQTIKDRYRDIIRRASYEEDKKLELEKSHLITEEHHKLSIAVRKAIEKLGFDVVEIDLDHSSHSRSLSVRTKVNYPKSVTDIEEQIRPARTKKCEHYKKLYRELDTWELECISKGEVLPFDVPDVPEDEIRCE